MKKKYIFRKNFDSKTKYRVVIEAGVCLECGEVLVEVVKEHKKSRKVCERKTVSCCNCKI